jgi:hypothetical protein
MSSEGMTNPNPARFSVALDGQAVTIVTDPKAWKRELAQANGAYLRALARRNALRKKLQAAEQNLQAAKKLVNLLLDDAAAAGQGAGELSTQEGATP